MIERLKLDIIQQKLLTAKAVYQFFKVRVDGDRLVILDHQSESEKMVFKFPRQSGGYQFCLTDFIHPDKTDIIAFFVVTSGNEVLDYARDLKEKEAFLSVLYFVSITFCQVINF